MAAAKDKDPDAPIPIKRSREETARHDWAQSAVVNPEKIAELIAALDDFIEVDDEGHAKRKKKKPKTDGGEPPKSKGLLYAVIGLLVSVLLSQAGQWLSALSEISDDIDAVLLLQEENMRTIEAIDRKVDLVSEDYEIMERALVDYIDRVGGPGVPLPDSVIILRDKHTRTR